MYMLQGLNKRKSNAHKRLVSRFAVRRLPQAYLMSVHVTWNVTV